MARRSTGCSCCCPQCDCCSHSGNCLCQCPTTAGRPRVESLHSESGSVFYDIEELEGESSHSRTLPSGRRITFTTPPGPSRGSPHTPTGTPRGGRRSIFNTPVGTPPEGRPSPFITPPGPSRGSPHTPLTTPTGTRRGSRRSLFNTPPGSPGMPGTSGSVIPMVDLAAGRGSVSISMGSQAGLCCVCFTNQTIPYFICDCYEEVHLCEPCLIRSIIARQTTPEATPDLCPTCRTVYFGIDFVYGEPWYYRVQRFGFENRRITRIVTAAISLAGLVFFVLSVNDIYHIQDNVPVPPAFFMGIFVAVIVLLLFLNEQSASLARYERPIRGICYNSEAVPKQPGHRGPGGGPHID